MFTLIQRRLSNRLTSTTEESRERAASLTWHALWFALVLTLALPNAASAQIEEVVVTAQRRAESLQDVPLAVSAFSAQQATRMGVTETLDLARLTPNFIAQNNTGLGTANSYALRGLSNTESIATFDPPVGTYIDDFFIQRQNANNYALFDIERIEVLRGPQGTLFGRNTTGGAVRIILKEPGDEFGGFVEAGLGRYDRVHFRGSVDVPISVEDIRGKFSAYYINDDGFVKNEKTREDDINKERNIGLRGALRWDLAPHITWDAALAYIEHDHANLLHTEKDNKRFSNTGLKQSAAPFASLITGHKRNFGLGNGIKSIHFTSDVEWQSRIGTASILTSYLDMRQEYLLDFFDGGGPTGLFTVANESRHKQFSQEVKLSGRALGDTLNYVAGLFYFNEDNETDYASYNFFATFRRLAPLEYDRILDNGVDSWALYGQLDWRVHEQWTLTAGLRYTDESKDFGITDNGNSQARSRFGDAELLQAGISLEQNKKILTPRFAVEYRHSDDLMVFASATRGFKSGGWNARGVPADQLEAFAPETVWNYEAGLRSEWLASRLRVNLTGFYSDVSDFQLPGGVDTGAGIEFITGNFADLEVYGFEAELQFTPVERLYLYANIGIMEADYKNIAASVLEQQQRCREKKQDCLQSIVNATGDIAPPTRTPEHTVAIGGWYTLPIGENMNLIPAINVTDYGAHNVNTSGAAAALLYGYTLVSGGVTLQHTTQDWSLTASCKNCTDQEYFVTYLATKLYLGDPATWSLTFNKRF